MGGGHHEQFKVPHYSIYNNFRQFPELAEHERRLGQVLSSYNLKNFVHSFIGERHSGDRSNMFE